MNPVGAIPITVRRTDTEDLTLTGPHTIAGRYLRRFWQPVYHSVDLEAGRAVPLRIMSEDFTLYRGEDGVAYLTEARCPHRRTLLATGWVEGSSLRCFYHGWKFGSDGQCIEQPAEESRFAHKIQIRTWPTKEYLGLVFAYLGEGEPPDFPRYRPFERFSGLVEVDSYLRECNYFQNLENALDMSHVGFVHGNNRAAFDGIGLGRSLEAVESDWGVTYTFNRSDGQRRVQQLGMPNVFYMTALPNEVDVDWQESLFWWVPIDDNRHVQFSLHRVPLTGDVAERFKARRLARRAKIDMPHQVVCESILSGRVRLADVDADRVDLVRLQDNIAQIGQGRIASRDGDRLGRADIGVTVTRRLWVRELNALAENRPLKEWRRTPDIVPRVWSLSPGAPADVALGATAEQSPEVVDIRPFVEVEMQLKALHSVMSPCGLG